MNVERRDSRNATAPNPATSFQGMSLRTSLVINTAIIARKVTKSAKFPTRLAVLFFERSFSYARVQASGTCTYSWNAETSLEETVVA